MTPLRSVFKRAWDSLSLSLSLHFLVSILATLSRVSVSKEPPREKSTDKASELTRPMTNRVKISPTILLPRALVYSLRSVPVKNHWSGKKEKREGRRGFERGLFAVSFEGGGRKKNSTGKTAQTEDERTRTNERRKRRVEKAGVPHSETFLPT